MTMVILAPISWAFMRLAHALSKNAKNDSAEAPSFTEDELYVMIDEVAEEGALERSEGELVKSAMQFDDIKVSEMYTPKANIAAVDIRAGMEEVKTTFMKSEYSRIPVYDDSIDRIIGAVHSKDFFYKYIEGEDIILEDMIRPVKFVGEDMIIATLLSDLQKSHIHVAIVVDGDGRTLGMVTMEDILEELVGEIWDERDEAVHPIHEERDGSFTVPGEANIFEVMKRIGMDFNPGDFQDHSVSAFISHNMDRVPKKGDMIDMGESKIIVRSMKSRRVREARILPVKKEVSPQEDRGS
jgi:CBS domain containing-hemolysin-like protein